MSIDLEIAKKNFIDYTANYDVNDSNIDRKIGHSIRVMKISREIATRIGLKQEQIDLATLIGLLHDIARFEQYKKFQTFYDLKSFDHGDYAVKILEKDLRKYIQDNKYDEIIKKAIKNHNKFEIEKGLSDEELLFAKIIRDADKIDIMYESVCIFFKGEEEKVNNSLLLENVYEKFKSENLVKREKNVNIENINKVVSVLAFIFDINFKATYEILKENDYINKILDRYNIKDEQTRERIKEIRKKANEYLNNKIMRD